MEFCLRLKQPVRAGWTGVLREEGFSALQPLASRLRDYEDYR